MTCTCSDQGKSTSSPDHHAPPPHHRHHTTSAALLAEFQVIPGYLFLGTPPSAPGGSPITFAVSGEQFSAAHRTLPNRTKIIEITDNAGATHIASPAFNPHMRWFFIEDQGRVWLYSGDIGTYILGLRVD